MISAELPPPTRVSVCRSERPDYPAAPFAPPEPYPELAGVLAKIGGETNPANLVYPTVRKALLRLGLDAAQQGTVAWNPLAGLIAPGQRVVLKPNFVKGEHPLGDAGVASMITHASVMRPLIDYVLLATGGEVEIVIADVPLQSSVWEDIIERSGTKALVEFYAGHGIHVGLLDLRREIAHFNGENVIVRRDYQDRDPRGYAAVDLGRKSALMPVIGLSDRLEITDYPYRTVGEHHNAERNEYLICKTVLAADLFINVPKLKTHKKAALTVAMKNLIGINGDKSWIAHHRRGLPAVGGDEFPTARLVSLAQYRVFSALKARPSLVGLATLLKILFRKTVWRGRTLEEVRLNPGPDSPVYEGGWFGNDTIWRCMVDLNVILFFADKEGRLQDRPQRNYLCVVDGILAGEGEGPMEQTPKPARVIMSGLNPLAVDYAAARVMGFDPEKIPAIREGFRYAEYPLAPGSSGDIAIVADYTDNPEDLSQNFTPPVHWRPILRP